jgi:hypothetical protein
MTVTQKLFRLYLVDQQIRGLTSRLVAAEKYLATQESLMADLSTRHAAAAAQLRQLEATNKNDEVEAASIEARIVTLRERMNTAKTSKEHAAFLAEVGNLKDSKKIIEDRILEAMARVEALKTQVDEIDAQKKERQGVRKVAAADRESRAAEIKDRLAELQTQREHAQKDVPSSALIIYDARLAMGVEDVMAPIEEQDRRNLEYTCGACFTHLPIEQVSILLRRGDLTRCTTCQAILYMAQELKADIEAGQQKKQKKSAAAAQE